MKDLKFMDDNFRLRDYLGPIIKRADVVRVELDGDLSFCIQCIGEYTHRFNYETKAERDEDYNRTQQWFYGEPPKANKEIDWEQRRYELSKDFLARCNFSYDVYNSCVRSSTTATETIAKAAVMLADALISELKKKQ